MPIDAPCAGTGWTAKACSSARSTRDASRRSRFTSSFEKELNISALERYLNSQQAEGPAEPEALRSDHRRDQPRQHLEGLRRADHAPRTGQAPGPAERAEGPPALFRRRLRRTLEPAYLGYDEHRGPVDRATRYGVAPALHFPRDDARSIPIGRGSRDMRARPAEAPCHNQRADRAPLRPRTPESGMPISPAAHRGPMWTLSCGTT